MAYLRLQGGAKAVKSILLRGGAYGEKYLQLFSGDGLGTCALCVSERRVCMAASLVAESSEPLLQCKVCSPLAANSIVGWCWRDSTDEPLT